MSKAEKLKRWLKRPMLCKIGLHEQDFSRNWGYALGSGVVDLYCHRCGKRIGEMPLEDLPPEMRDRIKGAADA